MNVVSVPEDKNNLEQIISDIVTSMEPVIITTDGGQQMVLLSMKEFNSWQETLYLLSTSANTAHLQKSILEAQTGKTIEVPYTTRKLTGGS